MSLRHYGEFENVMTETVKQLRTSMEIAVEVSDCSDDDARPRSRDNRRTLRFMPYRHAILVGVVLVVLLHPVCSFAEMFIYTVEGKIRAAFPGQPVFVGELGQGNLRHRSYQFLDEPNVLVYSLTWQIGKTVFKANDVPEALLNLTTGDAISVNGDVVLTRFTKIDGNMGIHYTIAYRLGELEVRKYKASFYRDGQFFSWSVQDFPGISRFSAEASFLSYVAHFSLVIP